MSDLKNRFQIFRKIPLQVIGTVVLFLAAACLLWFNQANSNQALSAMMAQVRFQGEYRIGDGQWQKIIEGEHIPATKGDVTLRGTFHLYAPDGMYAGLLEEDTLIALYTDHIGLTIQQGENEPDMIEQESPMYGASACGMDWTAYSFHGGDADPIEIVVHNPHRFGNEMAVDELLSNVAIWENISFEREVLESGKVLRYTGIFLVVVAVAFLGTALFSALLHVRNNRIIWLLGLAILSAGGYLIYSDFGVSLWSWFVITNTTLLGLSMMFYMFFISGILTYFLQGTKRIGVITTAVLGVMDGIFFVLPMLTEIFFYDTWLFWVIGQTVGNIVLLGCLIKEYLSADRKSRLIYVGMALSLIAFECDAAATALGWWQGGFTSGYVFFALCILALVVILRIIPGNINAAAKAKELELQRSRLEAEKNSMEAELKESRISIMLSQIQPHFIYNTLGTIERMCLKDPEKAFDLVRNFSLYLRGNFSELDSVIPVRFTEEIKHVEYYVNIEKVRFPDMNIVYDVETTEFVLPALSVQPLVENAIKHGLMRLETGGTVLIRSYETETHFCVEVKDDGGGFDTSLTIEDKKHVGLRNIRGRLKAMVNGELIVESKPGFGTKAMIMIPKEVIE